MLKVLQARLCEVLKLQPIQISISSGFTNWFTWLLHCYFCFPEELIQCKAYHYTTHIILHLTAPVTYITEDYTATILTLFMSEG
jgi:hypothetical protein